MVEVSRIVKQEGVQADVQILEPGDPGFEAAARENGLWLPSGYEDEGVFYETSERMAPDDPDFEDTLEEVLERGLYATVRIPRE